MNEVFLDAVNVFLGFAIGITINILIRMRVMCAKENITKKDALSRQLPFIVYSLYFGVVISVLFATIKWYNA